MIASKKLFPARHQDIVLCEEGAKPARKTGDYVFCKFGVELNTAHKMTPNEPVEVEVCIPSEGGKKEEKILCLGVAIESLRRKNSRKYRTFVRLLDIPPSLRPHLYCHRGKQADICNFCRGTL